MPQDFLSSFALTFSIFGFLFSLAPYWLPILLGYIFWHLRMSYIQLVHISETESVFGIKNETSIPFKRKELEHARNKAKERGAVEEASFPKLVDGRMGW